MKTFLKNAREQKGLKTREVAQLLKIDQALISKFESGLRKPTRDQVQKLAELLEIDFETIFVIWLKEKILHEIGTERLGLEALKMAEKELKNKLAENKIAITDQLQKIVDRITILKDKLSTINPFDVHRISKSNTMNFIFETNALTGNSMSLAETKSVINEGITIAGKPMKEHLEIINFNDVVQYLQDSVQKNNHFSEKELLSLHNIILRGITKGQTGNYVSDETTKNEMEQFFIWFDNNKRNLHPIILAAEVHQKIMSILPFQAGNIEVALLAMNYILLQNGYLLTFIKSNEKDKNQYLTLLENSDREDLTLFLAQAIENNLLENLALIN